MVDVLLRRRTPLWLGIAAAVAGIALLLGFTVDSPPAAPPTWHAGRAAAGSAISPAPSADFDAYPPLPLRPGPVTVDTPGFWSWALLDMGTGEVNGDRVDERSTTASMIKPWLAADYLRRAAAANQTPSQARMRLLSIMIRDSDNAAATTLYAELGGAATIHRLIEVCGLTDSRPGSRWSLTELSARDAARMGGCIGDGRAAGPTWTEWLLNEMRQVRGEGDFGIREAFPPDLAAATAIKNGWFPREEDGNWHFNCFAVGDGWALSVIQRYPRALGFAHGRTVCRSVAEQLLLGA